MLDNMKGCKMEKASKAARAKVEDIREAIEARKRIEKRIYEATQAYIWERDDERAETINARIEALEASLNNANKAIDALYLEAQALI